MQCSSHTRGNGFRWETAGEAMHRWARRANARCWQALHRKMVDGLSERTGNGFRMSAAQSKQTGLWA